MKNKIILSNRLLKCAEMITPHSKIADIGTDHAYIPIYLSLNRKITHAIASDLRKGPLENAQKNIKLYNLETMIETRISNGLENILENEADEIIIAGLGGNIIIDILEKVKWINKRFIIQPMKYEKKLRAYMADAGYNLIKEEAVICSKKVYTAMEVIFTGKKYDITPEEEYIGKIKPQKGNIAATAYIKKQIKDLENHKKGANAHNVREKEKYFENIINNLSNIIK